MPNPAAVVRDAGECGDAVGRAVVGAIADGAHHTPDTTQLVTQEAARVTIACPISLVMHTHK